MEKYYTFDIYGLDAEEQGTIVTLIKKTSMETQEVIARAYEWLKEKDFLDFMEWWKYNDYQPLIYGNFYGDDNGYFIVAQERGDEVRIVWWVI